GELPNAGFAPDGSPLREYFREPSWARHVMTWVNLKSKLGNYILRSARLIAMRARPPIGRQNRWWADPDLARKMEGTPAVARSRSLLRAIQSECRTHGSRLIIMVVGPVPTYASKDGGSPLGQILAGWGIDAPVIDVAANAIARPDWQALLFPRDGHLN